MTTHNFWMTVYIGLAIAFFIIGIFVHSGFISIAYAVPISFGFMGFSILAFVKYMTNGEYNDN